MRAGRGLSRLTGAAAPRPGLWQDDEERAPEGLTGGAAPRPGLWPLDGELRAALDERAAAAEEDPDVELAALCGGGGSVLGMLLDFTLTMTFGLSF
jgi:hypothetical protein